MKNDIMCTSFTAFIKENAAVELPETINVNGQQKPTRNSNGEYIHTTEQGIINFYKWFGKSKMVDDDGKPMVVYHGTSREFDVFTQSSIGKMGEGMYFTSIKKDAEYYKNRYSGSIILSVYLKTETLADISNPFRRKQEIPEGTQYDGIRGYKGYSGEEIIVYEPNQIKSVENDGSFDLNDNNIYS